MIEKYDYFLIIFLRVAYIDGLHGYEDLESPNLGRWICKRCLLKFVTYTFLYFVLHLLSWNLFRLTWLSKLSLFSSFLPKKISQINFKLFPNSHRQLWLRWVFFRFKFAFSFSYWKYFPILLCFASTTFPQLSQVLGVAEVQSRHDHL